ncbi:hypothetical protein BDV36DRAFT_254036 [Aspergillus pseudocaelatus]|uniref:Uncharacterized protein n=1 Tax=Aspergillus pseudocaelatus TaxID=1825620 RepID=A0ABQ6WMY5_9EURO|nr:hypothetical protein BDV36DRAFT_254036 [Aspergillus pseudocaelatus]
MNAWTRRPKIGQSLAAGHVPRRRPPMTQHVLLYSIVCSVPKALSICLHHVACRRSGSKVIWRVNRVDFAMRIARDRVN